MVDLPLVPVMAIIFIFFITREYNSKSLNKRTPFFFKISSFLLSKEIPGEIKDS